MTAQNNFSPLNKRKKLLPRTLCDCSATSRSALSKATIETIQQLYVAAQTWAFFPPSSILFSSFFYYYVFSFPAMSGSIQLEIVCRHPRDTGRQFSLKSALKLADCDWHQTFFLLLFCFLSTDSLV